MSQTAVMISHSSADAEAAQQLCALLEQRAVPCWIAPRDLAVGEEWTDGIIRGIETAGAMVLLVSEHINTSPHVLAEITQAVHQGKPIYPVVIGDVHLTRSLDFYLRPRHWLFAKGKTLSDVVSLLERAINSVSTWDEVAVAPSLLRRLRYGNYNVFSAAFRGSLAAVALVAGGAAVVGKMHADARDAQDNANYLSVGWVVPSTASRPIAPEKPDGQRWMVSGSIFLAGENPRFTDISLVFASPGVGQMAPFDVTAQLQREQVGNAQSFAVHIPALAKEVAVCLSRAHPALKKPHRVDQFFHLRDSMPAQGEERVEFIPSSEPKVVASPSAPCGR